MKHKTISLTDKDIPESAPCKACDGTGVNKWDGGRRCYTCDGAGAFAKPDLMGLLNPIRSKKSRTGLVSKRPKDDRQAWLWRMIRFHTGADVTMPWTFTLRGDPYASYIDDFAIVVARKLTGHASAGGARWSGLLSNGPLPTTPDMPMTAFACGPVVTDNHDPITMAMLADEARASTRR